MIRCRVRVPGRDRAPTRDGMTGKLGVARGGNSQAGRTEDKKLRLIIRTFFETTQLPGKGGGEETAGRVEQQKEDIPSFHGHRSIQSILCFLSACYTSRRHDQGCCFLSLCMASV